MHALANAKPNVCAFLVIIIEQRSGDCSKRRSKWMSQVEWNITLALYYRHCNLKQSANAPDAFTLWYT